MENKEQIYEDMLCDMMVKLEEYICCLETIQDNYKIQIPNKEVLLQGQLQMIYHLINRDKQKIENILEKEYIQ